MKQHTLFYFVLIMLSASGLSCKSGRQTAKSEQIDYQTIADNTLENRSKCVENEENTYVLCIVESKVPGPRQTTFIIIEPNTGELVVDITRLEGEVTWYKETQLLIKEYPGVIENKTGIGKQSSYYYDIIKKRRIEANL